MAVLHRFYHIVIHNSKKAQCVLIRASVLSALIRSVPVPESVLRYCSKAVIEPNNPICTDGMIMSPLVRDRERTSCTRLNTESVLLKELKEERDLRF